MNKSLFMVIASVMVFLCLFFQGIPAYSQPEMPLINVFYKNRAPSLKTLAKTKELLESYKDRYEIKYLLITDPKNSSIIKEIGLPGTHFPFAVVINGKTTANIDAKSVTFCEFPDFMHGIGRHEGNWSLEALKKVLEDNTLLSSVNILPEADHHHHDECDDNRSYSDSETIDHGNDSNKKPHHNKDQAEIECDGDCRNCEHRGNCPYK